MTSISVRVLTVEEVRLRDVVCDMRLHYKPPSGSGVLLLPFRRIVKAVAVVINPTCSELWRLFQVNT